MKTRCLKVDPRLQCVRGLEEAARLVPRSVSLEAIGGVRSSCTGGQCCVVNLGPKPTAAKCCSKCNAVTEQNDGCAWSFICRGFDPVQETQPFVVLLSPTHWATLCDACGVSEIAQTWVVFVMAGCLKPKIGQS